MKRVTLSTCFVALAILAMTIPGVSQERKLTKTELPSAVRKAAEQESKGATVRGYSTEVENGQREYEVETAVNGHSRDVTIAPDGKILEIEEQVQMRELPQSVQKALHAKAGSGTITKIESLTHRGKLVAYEAQVRKAGKHSEIQVGPNGEALAHPE